MATELQEELARLSDQPPANGRRRRPAARRTTRSLRTAARLVEAFQAECEALGTTLQRVQERGAVMTSQQLSDLRLGERTRRIFRDAGLQHVQDVASLSPEGAADIPQLVPASLAELRAAIMFAAESSGVPKQHMLPPPRDTTDLFEGLAQTVNQLPPSEREAAVLRTGAGDRVYEVDEVAYTIGCSTEQVPIFQEHALNLLLAQPASMDACWNLEALCKQLGLGWDDARLPTVVAALYPNTRASFTRLVAWMLREKGRLIAEAGGQTFVEPHGVAHFEEMVVAALGRYGDLSGELLTSQVRAALSNDERELYPDISVAERVQILGPAVRQENGTFQLPNAPIPGMDDRHIRALNGLIGAMQKLGSARISSLTAEVNHRLPRQYQINEHYVRTWLTRHPELFVQADAERFKLASLDVDILCGLATSWRPAETAGSVAGVASRPGGIVLERMQERVAAEVADLLRRQGPLPIARIRSHLYGRFVGVASADAVIAASPHRFVRTPNGLITLHEGDDGSNGVLSGDQAKHSLRRFRFWQRR